MVQRPSPLSFSFDDTKPRKTREAEEIEDVQGRSEGKEVFGIQLAK
jgi:hypothetical protein